MMEFEPVQKAVASALSGNGKFKVNWEIRRIKDTLMREFGYTTQSFKDLSLDYTITMLDNHVIKKKFDPKRGGLNGYLTTVTRNYLLNTLKKHRLEKTNWIECKSGEIRECEVVSQYDLDINSFIENAFAGTKLSHRPDKLYEYSELVNIIESTVEGIDVMILEGRITQGEAAIKLGVSREWFNKKHNERVEILLSYLRDGGYSLQK